MWWQSRDGDNSAKVRSIYKRACENHLPTSIDMHDSWAAFEENLGEFELAANILENIHKEHPQMISLLIKRINLERRRNNHDKVCELYESAISESTNKSVAGELSIKYARFARLHLMDPEKASSVIEKAIEADMSNTKLYLQHLDILINTLPLNVPKIVAVFNKALDQDIHEKQKFCSLREN